MSWFKPTVYKITNDIDNKIYVGYTTCPMFTAKTQHKQQAKLYPHTKLYSHILSIGWEHCKLEILEDCPENDKEHLLKRCQYYIDLLKPELNTVNKIKNEELEIITKEKYRQTERYKELKRVYSARSHAKVRAQKLAAKAEIDKNNQ